MTNIFKSRIFRLTVGLIITALALWLSFRRVDWSLLGETFLRVNLLWVVLAVVNSMITVYALGIRWQILLNPEKKVSLYELFRLNIICQCVNIIVPARLGEVLRAYLVSKRHKISGAHAMGTIVIEKVFDFFVFLAFWILVPPLLAVKEQLKGYKLALIFCFLVLLVIFILIWKREGVLKLGKKFSLFVPRKYRARFVDFFDRSLKAFNMLKSFKTLLLLLVLSLLFVGSMILTNYFLFLAFDLDLSLWVALFLILALQVGSIPPSSPGKVGVFEYTVILALAFFAVPKGEALSYGLMLHAVSYLPKILLGLIFIAQLDISLKKKYHLKENETRQTE
jgi:uncharacterized protein (TIRG00374 family)